MKTGWKIAFTVTAIIVIGSIVFSAIAFHKKTCHVCGEKGCAIDMSYVNLGEDRINVCPRCSYDIFTRSIMNGMTN